MKNANTSILSIIEANISRLLSFGNDTVPNIKRKVTYRQESTGEKTPIVSFTLSEHSDYQTKEKEVGDILNCGRKNKYTVFNKNGEQVVVHNCGYSGGYNALCRFGFDRFPLADGDVEHALSVMSDVMREDDIECFFITKPTKDVYELLNDSRYKEDTENFIKQIKGTWIVKQWRKNHPNVTRLWYDAVSASIESVKYPNRTIILRRDKG